MSEQAGLPIALPVGVIEGDVQCRKCGYNLRGMDVARRCPECGTPVGYSVQGDLLRFSDPGWVGGLRRGINLILIGVAVTIVVVIASAVAGAARASGIARLMPIVVLAAQTFGFVGTWLLTESDPSGLGEEDYGQIRKFIRIALLIGVGSAFLNLLHQLSVLPPEVMLVVTIVSSVASLVGLVGYCCQLVYLGRLARRVPDDAIARRAKTLAWTIGASYGSVIVIGIVILLFGRSAAGLGPRAGGLGPAFAAVGCFAAIAGLVLIVAVIFYLLMLERFAKRLKGEEAAARLAWASTTTPAAPLA